MAAVVSINTYPQPNPSPRSVRVSAPRSRSHRSAAVYRRRRFVAAAIGLGILLAVGQAGAALGGSSLAPVERRPQVVTAVVVEPGDTLWSIAQELAPDADTREVVDAIVEARGTAVITPGETITWLAQ